MFFTIFFLFVYFFPCIVVVVFMLMLFPDFSGGYVTVNGEVKRVSTATTAGPTVTGPSGSSNMRNSSTSTGTAVMVGTVTAAPQTTEYVEEVVEAEGVVMAASHHEPLTKRPRVEGDGPSYEDD